MKKTRLKEEIFNKTMLLLEDKKEVITSSQNDIQEGIDFLYQNGVSPKEIPTKMVKAVEHPNELVIISKDGEVVRKTGACLSIHTPQLYSFCTNLLQETQDEVLEEILYEGNDNLLVSYLVSKEYIVLRIFFAPFDEKIYVDHTQLFSENIEQKEVFEHFMNQYRKEQKIQVNEIMNEIAMRKEDSFRI